MVKISIIIPIYNSEKYLYKCIESVINQTLREIEIICIDDGSTDSSLSILEKFKEKDNRIIVISQRNEGAGVARNVGIKNANGEFVIFIDSDDFYPGNYVLEKLYKNAKINNAKICGGSMSSYSTANNEFTTIWDNTLFGNTFYCAEKIFYKDYQFDYGFHRFIYNLSFLLSNNIYFPVYRRFQDPPFFVNAMIKADIFYCIPDIVYCYRYDGLHFNWTIEKVLDFFKGINDNLETAKENKLYILYYLTVSRIIEFFPQFSFIRNILLIKLILEIYNKLDKSILYNNINNKYENLIYSMIFDEKEKLKDEITNLKNEINNLNDKKKQMKVEINNLRDKIKILNKENNDLISPNSYLVGRFILWLPRKIKKFLIIYFRRKK